MEYSIDEIFTEATKFDADGDAYFDKGQALTAIYEIGLECIGADTPRLKDLGWIGRQLIAKENKTKASQRKAWAKVCGVPE